MLQEGGPSEGEGASIHHTGDSGTSAALADAMVGMGLPAGKRRWDVRVLDGVGEKSCFACSSNKKAGICRRDLKNAVKKGP